MTEIRDDRRVWDQLLKRARRLDRLKIQSGIFREAGGATDDASLSVAQNLAFHEFGLGVPERSVIRATVRENKVQGDLDKAYGRATKQVLEGKSVKTAAGQIGETLAEAMRAKIRARIPPPLDPATIARKGSTVPIIDSGQTIQSISSRVLGG